MSYLYYGFILIPVIMGLHLVCEQLTLATNIFPH
jgi:hypothetical protein